MREERRREIREKVAAQHKQLADFEKAALAAKLEREVKEREKDSCIAKPPRRFTVTNQKDRDLNTKLLLQLLQNMSAFQVLLTKEPRLFRYC